MKMHWKFFPGGYFSSWYLIPTVRCGLWKRETESGGWFYLMWLKSDICGVTWSKK